MENIIEETLDISQEKDYMIGYDIVNKIYEIRDYFLFSEDRIEYNILVMNKKIIDLITEVNFVYVKDCPIFDQVLVTTKVGNLMNFEVYLDPKQPDNIISILSKDQKKIELKIIL